MIAKTLKDGAAIAGLAAALSLTAVTAGNAAHWGGGHWGPGAAIGAGVAGFALGAAAASTAYYGYSGYSGYGGYGGYYDYDPGTVVVVPGPVYYDYEGVAPYDGGPVWYSGRRPGNCRFDIRAC
jgi:hypothetical protein